MTENVDELRLKLEILNKRLLIVPPRFIGKNWTVYMSLFLDKSDWLEQLGGAGGSD